MEFALERSQTSDLETYIHSPLTDKVRAASGDSDPQGCISRGQRALAPDTARPPADSLHRRL